MSNEIKYKEYIDYTDPVRIIYPITVGPGEYLSCMAAGWNDITLTAVGFEIEISTGTVGDQKRLGALDAVWEFFSTLYSTDADHEALVKVIVNYKPSSGSGWYTLIHGTS